MGARDGGFLFVVIAQAARRDRGVTVFHPAAGGGRGFFRSHCAEALGASPLSFSTALSAIAGCFLASGCSPSAEAPPPSINPPRIEQLKGPELVTAIRGRTIVRRRTPIETPSSEQLRSDGTYLRISGRLQAQGRYEIMEDRYCVTVSQSLGCFSLHRDDDGKHYLRQTHPIISDYFPVYITN